MQIKVQQSPAGQFSAMILPFHEGKVDMARIQAYMHSAAVPDFEGKFKEVVVLYPQDGNQKVFLLGLGTENDLARVSLAFRSFGFLHHAKCGKTPACELSHLDTNMIREAAVGFTLATYHPGAFKTDKAGVERFTETESVTLIHPDKEGNRLGEDGVATADTQIHMMQLVDSPGNQKTPQWLARYAVESAAKYAYKATVWDLDRLHTEGFKALIAVGQGSVNPPVLIRVEYQHPDLPVDHQKIGLVGKGITFDTGGLSIKSATNMHYMKSDMGGAAAVLGAVELAARLKLPVHVVGVIPSAENSVDALSVRPGDVIGSYSGKTIEVIDTDAEGRLVLADGLAYLQQQDQPDTIIDLATLTGSCVAALGYAAAGMFTHNDELAASLETAGTKVRERVWRLPLWADYEDALDSDVADVKNFSGKPVAGAITAAKFLEFFIKDHPRWAHLDIAGVAFGDSEFTKMKSATAYGVRLLVEFLSNSEKQEAKSEKIT